MALPGVSLPPPPLAATLADEVAADDDVLLLVHAASAAPAPSAPAPKSRPRRPMARTSDGEAGMADLLSCGVGLAKPPCSGDRGHHGKGVKWFLCGWRGA